jgi:hypothetical protein
VSLPGYSTRGRDGSATGKKTVIVAFDFLGKDTRGSRTCNVH